MAKQSQSLSQSQSPLPSQLRTLTLVADPYTINATLYPEQLIAKAEHCEDCYIWKAVYENTNTMAAMNNSLSNSSSRSANFQITPEVLFNILSDYTTGNLSLATKILFPQTFAGFNAPFEIEIIDICNYRGQEQTITTKLEFVPLETTYEDRINKKLNKLQIETANKIGDLHTVIESTKKECTNFVIDEKSEFNERYYEQIANLKTDIQSTAKQMTELHTSVKFWMSEFHKISDLVHNERKHTEEICHNIIKNDLHPFVKNELQTFIKNELPAFVKNESSALVKNELHPFVKNELQTFIKNELPALVKNELTGIVSTPPK